MTITLVKSSSLIVLAIVVGVPAVRLQALAAPATVLDGAYTGAQAVRGLTAYTANCARCHRDSLEGNAEALSLVGGRFIESWRDDTLDGLFMHMSTRMPRRPGGEPGSLSKSTYLDILAYILKVNNFPEGSDELTAQTVTTVLLVDHGGPKPLPTNSLVEVIGCFSSGPNKDSWQLRRAGQLHRTRDAENITPEDIKASAARPLGSQTFDLRNVPDFRAGFVPESIQGRKVTVRGALTRHSDNDRIYVTALEPVAMECTP